MIKIDEKTGYDFQSWIKSMSEFTREWKSCLERAEIDENKLVVSNGLALEMIEKAEWQKNKLTSLVFNKKVISFAKNVRGVEMGNIGVVKYKGVGGYDLNDFRKIDITDINWDCNLKVYPQNDGCFNLLGTVGKNIIQVTIDKHNNVIVPDR